jgi:hypothetical protein
MPLDPNNPKLKLGGRKGYDIEQEQKNKMQKALDRDLALLERIQTGKASEYDQKIFPSVQARMLKYLDKLHVSKSATDITTGGESLNKVLVQFVNEKPKDDTDTTGV